MYVCLSVCWLQVTDMDTPTREPISLLNIVFRTISTKYFFRLFKILTFDHVMAFSSILGRFGVIFFGGYWTADIIVRQSWALIGYSVIKTCVCLCVQKATGHSFWPRNLFFGTILLGTWEKKTIFLFFEFLVFGSLRALFRPFSSIFFFILCKSSVRATSHTDCPRNGVIKTLCAKD